MSWSGGKDSCLALHRAAAAGIRPRALLTMMIEDGARSRSHGLRLELLEAQATSLGVPLVTRATSWDDYEATMLDALSRLARRGIELAVFGDLDLEPHREWVVAVCSRAGVEPVHPLWQEPRLGLLGELLELTYDAVVIAVRDEVLPHDLLGRRLDRGLVEELVRHGVDASGERGEYHTAILGGPLFREPVRARSGERVLRDGYWFVDLVPAPAKEAGAASVYSPA